MESPLPLQPPPPRSGGALKWVALGCGVFVVLAAVGAGLAIFFLVRAAAGTEVASAPGALGQESTVTFQVVEPVPHTLWIEYDVAYQGADFRLEGPIAVRSPSGVLAQDTLTLGPDGPPTAGGFARVQLNSRTMFINGQGAASGRVKLVEIPAQQAGTTITAGVAITPRPGTMLNAVRLVITR